MLINGACAIMTLFFGAVEDNKILTPYKIKDTTSTPEITKSKEI